MTEEKHLGESGGTEDKKDKKEPTRILKVHNVFDRNSILTPELHDELKEDFENEAKQVLQSNPNLHGMFKSIRVVRNGEEKLGAEVGSVFVEFKDKKAAKAVEDAFAGRFYDGNEIKLVFISESQFATMFNL